MRIEEGVPSLSQVCQEGGAMRRILPIRKPNPLPADDVDERVPHGTKATTQIARELLSAEGEGGLQDSIVGPAVVFVEQLNIIFCHL